MQASVRTFQPKQSLLIICLMAILVGIGGKSWGQLSLTNTSTAATINFSSTISGVNNGAYTASGITGSPATGQLNSNAWAVTGWSDGDLAFGGTRSGTSDFGRGATTVAVGTGGFYSYTGAPGSASNPAFMIQPGGSDFAPGTLTLRIQNNGTANITSLAISYNLFVRNDQARSSSFNFSYSTDNSSFTSVASLDYATPIAADAGNWVQVSTSPSRSTTINSLSITPGNYIYVRWSSADAGGTGSRDEIGLDDINITGTYASASIPPTLTATTTPTSIDNNFNVTYPADAIYTGATTGITITNGTTTNNLSSGTDYTIATSSGITTITFTPSASGAALLRTPGTYTVSIAATGYSAATVSQTLTVGAATKLAITTQPAAPATNGGTLTTSPVVVVQDKYSNTVTNSTASITAAVGNNGTWTLGGTATLTPTSGTATFNTLTATSTAAVTGATITFTATGLTAVTSTAFNIPAPAPANDLCSGAQTLIINAIAVGGNTTGATVTSPFTGNTDVWYKINTTSAGSLTISTTTSSQDIDLYIYSFTACPTGSTVPTAIASAATSADLTTESVTFSAAAAATYYVRVVYYSGTTSSTVGPFTIQATQTFTAPTLTAAAGATVDAPFTVTYTANAAYQTAITGITVGGIALPSTAYTLGAGTITFTPSASTLLQSAGSKAIVVTATNYTNAPVTQNISAGVATQLSINTQPAAPAANGGTLATQPIVRLLDQYGNLSSSTTSVTATVGSGTWAIGGTITIAAAAGTATFTNLTATSAAAITGATITFTASGLTSATSNAFDIPAPLTAISITTNPASLAGLNYIVGTGPSAAQSFTVTATNLTAGGGTITVSVPGGSNFEIATTAGGTYGNTVILTYTGTGSSITPNTVYVRLKSGLALGSYTETVSLSGGGANQSVAVSGSVTNCSALIAEDFDYGSVSNSNLLNVANGNWLYLSGNNPVKFNYTPSRGLVYPGYASSGVGGSANIVGTNASDIYRVISGAGGLTSGAVYSAFLMNFTSMGSGGDYFLPFKDNNTGTNGYYGKLFARSKSGSTTSYELGLSKFAGSASNYTGTFNFGQTYLVVVKYQFNTGTTNDDVVTAWTFANGVPASEATATQLISVTETANTDAANIYAITMRQNSGNNGYVDGIRVGTSWADAVCTGPVTPITYTWQPTAAGNYSFAASTNWSPVRSTIRNTDVLNFTLGGTTTATGVTGQGLGSISVSNNTNISFQSTTTSTALGINDDGTTAPDLSIAAGSSLTINSDSAIRINLIGKATANIAGTLTFNNQGTSGTPGRAHRITTETAGNVIFANGSIFNAQNVLGGAFNNDSSYVGTVQNGVIFQSGSTFNFSSGSNPFEFVQPATAVVFNSGSTFRQLTIAAEPSFAGRTYGNFEFNPASGVASLNFASTTPATILNDFKVTSGTLNFTTASQPLNIGGNVSVASGATFNYSPSTTTSATLSLNGTTAQTISGAGTFTLGNNSTLSANNAAGVSLSRDITVGGTLNLASGSFAVGANTLSLNGPAITGTPTNLTTTSASSLSYGGASAGIIIPSSVAQLNNLSVNNATGISLGGSTSVNGALTLTNGIVTTTSANALTVANTASGAIVGGSTTAFINGPLKRTFPTVSNSASAYVFPVGKASVYLPFSLSAFTTTANPVVSVEAFNTNSGGTAGTGLCAISNSEYWLASASTGYSSGSVSLTRQAALGNLNKIGRSVTQTGIYNSLNGTVSGTSVINSDPTGTSLGYFVMGTYTEISGLTYTLNPASYCIGNTIATNSPTFTAGASTSYSITPALPSGLSFNTSTGAITGQPTVASPATVYTIIATNATGCTTSVQVTITVNPLATASINGPNATLCPGSTSGVTITNTGTTPATITYTTQISGGSVVSHQVTLAAGSGTTLSDVVNATTTYTLVSVDNGTCPNNAPNGQVTVTVYPLPAVPASITGNNFVAVGATVQLTGAPSGGLWSIDNTTLADFATGSNNLTNPVLISGKAAGTPTITYTLTDNNSCTNKASVLLTVYDASLARYRSKQDGKASDASTWEVYTGTGNNWENTSNPPTNSSNIEIRHNVGIQDINYEGASGATLTITSHTANSTTVPGTLTVYPGRIFQSQGSVNFNNNLVVLRSDVSGTASIGFMTTPIANATNVRVENYTDARKLNALGTALIGSPRRTWRLITSPVTGQTIHEAWQENQALNVNPGTGFGTLITGEGLDNTRAASAGFDLVGGGNHTSIRQYDSSTNQWKVLTTNANLGTKIPLQSHPGYMLFVRGNRSVQTGAASVANLRATGTLKQGDQLTPIVPDRTLDGLPVTSYTVVGNPYAAPVNFVSIIAHNTSIKDEFYLWNSHLANYGAYVLVQNDGSDNYQAIPQPLSNGTQPGTITGNTYQYIPSGSAFLVSPSGEPSTTLTISEGDKAAGNAPPVNPFRVQSQNSKQLWVNLNLKDDDTSATLADGFVAKFDEAFAGNEEESSSQKAWNFNENLNVVRNGKSHIAEAHNDVKNTDTLFVQMWNVTERNYQLQMRADHFDSLLSTQAWLIDNYKGTKDEISLKGGVVTVNFDVTKDTASSKTDRFMIVFKNTASVLPVTLTSVKASQQDGGVQVNWTVTNETNINGYTVEKSIDGGRTFTALGTQQAAKNNPQAALTNYSVYDANPKVGDNYYQIRIEGKDGSITYSQVVTVTISRTGSGIQITLYPNPVREGKANLSLSNLQEGAYLVSVFSGSGQTVYQKKVTVTLASTTQTEQLLLGKSLAQGSYQIRVADSKGNILYSDKLVVGK